MMKEPAAEYRGVCLQAVPLLCIHLGPVPGFNSL